jgi:uncharacterized SAM-binding protein YcdF (DUF218 family)
LRSHRRPLWLRAAPILACGLAFAASAFVAGFVGFAGALPREEPTMRVEAEGIVVLTGGSDRIYEAAALLAHGQATRLLITGVNPATQGADLKRILPISRDLFACCVDLGYKAQDTAGNAEETREWVRERRLRGGLIVVTSNYHMPRALVELSAALPEMTLYPFPVVSDHVNVAEWSEDPKVLRLLVREYLKYLRAAVRVRWRAVVALM